MTRTQRFSQLVNEFIPTLLRVVRDVWCEFHVVLKDVFTVGIAKIELVIVRKQAHFP